MAEQYGTGGQNRVVITGVDIPFGELVGIILKLMLASIPAYILLFILFSIAMALFGGAMMAGILGGMR